MIFVADENIDQTVISCLRREGHEVLAVAEMEPGIEDEIVLARANERAALLVTEDKDFGELVAGDAANPAEDLRVSRDLFGSVMAGDNARRKAEPAGRGAVCPLSSAPL